MNLDIRQIWLQSDTFSCEQFLNSVHYNTSLDQFKRGLVQLKDRIDTVSGSEQDTKANLIVQNYDSFLAAKQVLDRINARFLENSSV